MDFATLTKSLNLPALSAFVLGVMASIGPCTMATNIAALAYISRKISDRKYAITTAALYTLGRMITYATLGTLIIYAGLSIPAISNFLQEFGEVVIGPFLILAGIAMIFIDRLSFNEGDSRLTDAASRFANMGVIGALPLGIILALVFCPYSAVLFFMVLIPMAMRATAGVGLSAMFALGTGLPVLIYGGLLSLGATMAAKWLNAISRAEKYIRIAVAILFIVVGLVYIGFCLE